MTPDNTRSYREVAPFYDMFANNKDLTFFQTLAERIGGPILELACGTGRVLLKLAALGHEIVGIDITSEMLAIANTKARALGEEINNLITLHEGDIADFDLKRKFPLIIIPSSFKFNLTTVKQLSCLESVKQHLTDEGVFILDHYPAALKPKQKKWTQGPSTLSDGRIVRRHITSQCDYIEQIQRFTAAYEIEFPNGMTDSYETENAQALIFERELELLLRIAGFKIVEEYGDWDFTPYSLKSERRIFILQSE